MRHASMLAIVLSCSSLSAQAYIETFTYPDGPVPAIWTEQSYTFAIQNQRLVPTGGRFFHYLTSNLFSNVATASRTSRSTTRRPYPCTTAVSAPGTRAAPARMASS